MGITGDGYYKKKKSKNLKMQENISWSNIYVIEVLKAE